MNRSTHPHRSCRSAALLVAVVLAGCASLSDRPPIEVQADLTRAAATPALKKYAWAFHDHTSADLTRPFRADLDAALAAHGYSPVPVAEATVLVYVLAEQDRLVAEKREMSSAELGDAGNPDSVRYKNVAAMMHGGRYSQLLDDHPNAPGEFVLGPQGELIATGSLRQAADAGHRPEKAEVRKINRLLLHAVDAPEPPDPADVTVRWKVEVVANVPAGESAPEMSRLVEAAIQHLGKRSHGPRPEADAQ